MRLPQSALAENPANDVSKKYAFVSTKDVLDTLARDGWLPVSAYEKRTNKEHHRGFQKHVIRLRKESVSYQVGDSLAELVLVNSHNRGSAVHLMAGIYRLICRNGAVVSMGNQYTHAIRHIGYAEEKVYCALDQIEQNVGKLHDRIKEYRTMMMTDAEKQAFAEQAALLRWESGKAVSPQHLLSSHRAEDTGSDLWSVFNVVQENMVRGGRFVTHHMWNYRRRRVVIRPITGLDQNLNINKKLWELMESFALTYQWRNSGVKVN